MCERSLKTLKAGGIVKSYSTSMGAVTVVYDEPYWYSSDYNVKVSHALGLYCSLAMKADGSGYLFIAGSKTHDILASVKDGNYFSGR